MLAPLAILLALSAADPPLPDRPDRNPQAPSGPGAFPGEAPAAPAESPPPPPRPRRSPGQATLIGAGALGAGGAAWLTEAGYPYLGVEYAQGLSAVDDLGGAASYTWTTSEMTLAADWRRELGATSGSRAGARLSGGLWFDFGDRWVYSGNRTNWGIVAVPGVAWTPEVGPGLLTLAADLALTWAMERGMGVAAAPAANIAYEFPVARDLSLGASAYVAVRWAAGSAQIPGLDNGLSGGITLAVTWRMF